MSIKTIVKVYIKNDRPRAIEELNWYREKPNLHSDIDCAALALNQEGKKHRHQWRLKRSSLEEARNILLANIDSIKETKDFDQLINLIDMLLEPVYGVGELYIYDTALKIGAKLDLLPEKVYLHAGTQEGARALGIPNKVKVIAPTNFPDEFQELKPYEIEDVLCIYKHILKKEKWK